MSNAIAGGVLLSDVRPPEKLRSALLIGDRWIEETSAGQLSHVNPATGKAQCVFPVAGKIEVDGAVAAARSVFPQWSTTPPNVRRDLLLRLAELLREHTPEFAGIAGLETGQPIGQARGTLAAEWATYYAGWVDKLDGRVIPTLGNSGLDYTLSEPYGVIGVMVPFNGPLTIAAMTVFPALAAGNCVVLKPSELTPFSCVHLAELVLEAGIPPGVLNLVTGGGVVGDALVRHPGVDKISFTGGPVTARKIMAAAAENLTPLLLELGGKSANLLFADAELQAASQFSATFSMLGSGQGCALPTRLFVEASVYDQVVDSVVSIVSGLKVGMPFDPTTNLGPVISRESQERILGVVRRACDEEAGTLLFGGERLGGELAEGFFMSPAVFGDVIWTGPGHLTIRNRR
jgi:aldehyde dehydrogenase (NAD+)